MEPYFHSIRKHEEYLIIDIKLPEDWRYKDIVQSVRDVVGFKDNGLKQTKRFLSFITKTNENDINKSVDTILKIVGTNLEREAKERLLEEKIIELKRQFEVSDLDTLKSLQFELNDDVKSETLEDTKTEVEDLGDEEVRLVEQGTE
tara:strand:+ start:12455 stop:12892 length:438 start_codon:yes stop_codon:yes gene_type:complete